MFLPYVSEKHGTFFPYEFLLAGNAPDDAFQKTKWWLSGVQKLAIELARCTRVQLDRTEEGRTYLKHTCEREGCRFLLCIPLDGDFYRKVKNVREIFNQHQGCCNHPMKFPHCYNRMSVYRED